MFVLAVLSFLRIPHRNSVCTSTLPRTCYTLSPTHSPLLDCPSNISVSSTNNEVPHCALFSSFLLLLLSYDQIPSSVPSSETPSAGVLPACQIPKFRTHKKRQTKLYFSKYCKSVKCSWLWFWRAVSYIRNILKFGFSRPPCHSRSNDRLLLYR
jgi:hypothetical protein